MKERTTLTPQPLSVTTPSNAPPPRKLQTLVALLARYGATSPEVLRAWVASASIATLVAEGQKLTTERLVKDGVILAGAAASAHAKMLPEQRAMAPAFDERLISAAVSVIDLCQRKGESRGDARATAVQLGGRNRGERRALAKRVTAQRALVYTTAITLAGGDPVRRAALDAAWGEGADPAHLATSHAAIVAILREVMAEARSRKVPVSVDDAWIDAHARLAESLEQAAGDAAVRADDGDVGQGEVAWWRGAALWFLRQMADQVDAVHTIDARVDRLPLGGLKSVLRHPPAKKKQKKGDAKKGEAKGEVAKEPEPAKVEPATRDAAKPA